MNIEARPHIFLTGTGASGRRMVCAIVDETPLRTISSMSGGLFPRPLVNALVALANLHTN
jgi:hypothetical protein